MHVLGGGGGLEKEVQVCACPRGGGGGLEKEVQVCAS